jgi:hypothetical protein
MVKSGTQNCSCKPWEILCWYNKHLKDLYWQYTDVNPWKINSKINRFLSYIKSFKFLFNINRLIIFLAIRLFNDETRHRFCEKYLRKKLL